MDTNQIKQGILKAFLVMGLYSLVGLVFGVVISLILGVWFVYGILISLSATMGCIGLNMAVYYLKAIFK